MQLQKFGHSCLLASEGNARLLIDPGRRSDGSEQLTGLTGILITHIHDDHLDVGRLRQLLERNPAAEVVCDAVSAAALAESGLAVRVVHSGDKLDGDVPIGICGHEHAVIHPDLPASRTSGT